MENKTAKYSQKEIEVINAITPICKELRLMADITKAAEYRQKKMEVINAIAPICEAVGILCYDYIFNDKEEILVLNDTKIGCTSNSIAAIINELLQYIIIHRRIYLGAFDKQTKSHMKQFWLTHRFVCPKCKKESLMTKETYDFCSEHQQCFHCLRGINKKNK